MLVVSTFHAPSSVAASATCRLVDNDQFLVIAHTNRLDVFRLTPEGLQFACSLNIWGRVVALQVLPTSSAPNAHANLLVMTDHPTPILLFLKYAPGDAANPPSLEAFHHISLFQRGARPSEFVHDFVVHPNGTVALASCYAGKLTVILLRQGKPTSPGSFEIGIPELNLLSFAFIPTSEDTRKSLTFALLHRDHHQRFRLLARNLRIEDLDAPLSDHFKSTVLSSSHYSIDSPDHGPKIIPVHPLSPGDDAMDVDGTDPQDNIFNSGGLLIVGGSVIQFFALTDKYEVERSSQMTRPDPSDDEVDNSNGHDEKARLERENKLRRASRKISWPYGEVVSWCPLGAEQDRFIVADSSGRLAMIALDAHHTTELIIIPLGVTSVPTSMAPLSSQVVYIGSHSGDSQLVRLDHNPSAGRLHPSLVIPDDLVPISPTELVTLPKAGNAGKGKARDRGAVPGAGIIVQPSCDHLDVMDNHTNLAPILDAVLADLDGSGQAQIIVCAGSRNTGAIKVVRTGADFQELASISGPSNITRLWSLREQFNDSKDFCVAATTATETRVFRLHPTQLLESLPAVRGTSFVHDLSTLAFGNIAPIVLKGHEREWAYDTASPLVVQVTSAQVTLLRWDRIGNYERVGTWNPDNVQRDECPTLPDGWKSKRIVVAGLNPSQIALALSGGRVVVLKIEGTECKIVAARDFRDPEGEDCEIASISCEPLDPDKNFTTKVVISFWRTNTVEVLNLSSSSDKLASISKPLSLPALATSALLYNFGSKGRSKNNTEFHGALLVGLNDGSLVVYDWRDEGVGEKKVHQLGSMPVFLAPLSNGPRRSVFASGGRASIVFRARSRIQLSPVALKNVMAASPLETDNFGSSFIISTPSGLTIGKVKELDKMHIRSIPFGFDNPRIIVHQPKLKAFGVGFTSAKPNRIHQWADTTSSFRLLDQFTFQPLAHFFCANNEEITAVRAVSFKDGSESLNLFAVGIMELQLEEVEPARGRLLIFKAERDAEASSASLIELASAEMAGCPYTITTIGDVIAVAVNSAVTFHRLKRSNSGGILPDATGYELVEAGAWNHNYTVTQLVANEDRLIVGDAIQSVSVIKLGVNGKVETLGRDYTPLWPVAIESLKNGGVLAANSDCNLFTFRLEDTDNGVRRMLTRQGEYYVDDLVNKFLPGSLSSSKVQNSEIEPQQLFFTSTGRIGAIMDVSEKLSKHLSDLQRNMGYVVKGPGEAEHAVWRAPVGGRARSDAQASSTGFLDGDFLEQFLHYAPGSEEAEDIMRGKNEVERLELSYEQIQQVLETLQSMH